MQTDNMVHPEGTFSQDQSQKKYFALFTDFNFADVDDSSEFVLNTLQNNETIDTTNEIATFRNDELVEPEEYVQHLDLNIFKIYPCSNYGKHNHKECPYYHYSKDRRRPKYNYFGDLCEFFDDAGRCPKGDLCPNIHSRAEQLYTPEKYKTKFCAFYPNKVASCDFGTCCSFAHSEKELRIPLIHYYQKDFDFYMFHYKTVLCPYNLSEHDKTTCMYAHNWQDYRRKPNFLNYEARLCPDWKTSEFLKNYEDGGCPLNEKCLKCHGWKELEYHPEKYKMKSCTLKKCLSGKICPYYHTADERRMTNQNSFFKVAPKNRVAENIIPLQAKQSAATSSELQRSIGQTRLSGCYLSSGGETSNLLVKKKTEETKLTPPKKQSDFRNKENVMKLKKDHLNKVSLDLILNFPDEFVKLTPADHIASVFGNSTPK